MYLNEESVRGLSGLSESIDFKVWVHQDSTLSPLVFNVVLNGKHSETSTV